MEMCFKFFIFIVSIFLFQNGLLCISASRLFQSKVYIVYMGARQQEDVELTTANHYDMLATVLGSQEVASSSMVYSYRHSFSGFAAKMTKAQAQNFSGLPGVVRVIPNFLYKTQTTRTWDYLGLSLNNSAPNLETDTDMGNGTIIGLLDTGVTPENEAYNDEGHGPIPSKWKGYCETGDKSFNPKKDCNRKLIGARYFIDGYLAEIGQPKSTAGVKDFISPRDNLGHGTHTSSTAAGSVVPNASYKGLALGTLRGGAPRSRVAMYKVCWEGHTCTAVDFLKAFDEAIHDGVDVISVSIGYDVPLYSEVDPNDLLNFGSFHAVVTHGISVVAAGGNRGPAAQTLCASAPWILTVAASTPDRDFPTPIILGNGQSLKGESILTRNDTGAVTLGYDDESSGLCDYLSQNDKWISGSVVLCFVTGGTLDSDRISDIVKTVEDAGGLGVIVSLPQVSAVDFHDGDFPCVYVDFLVGSQIVQYLGSTSNPRVRLCSTKTQIGQPISSVVSFYSSRGPYTLAPDILKPDIAAPGTNILAAYISPSPTISAYHFLSGTSMATPHVAAIVALLKEAHPDWSPTAIKSAIVTTGWTTDPFSGEPIFSEGVTDTKLADPFDYGGGLINPNAAKNPGLVYDMGTTDYLHCLCAMGYNSTAISQLSGQPINCPEGFSILDVNFPSITIHNLKGSVTLTRMVTNVGPINSIYKLIVEPPRGISVSVKPNALIFTPDVKNVSFTVRISTSYRYNTGYYFGSLTWNDGHHNVRIPLSVKTVISSSI